MNNLTASDGTKLSFNYWKGQPQKTGVLLVHQLPANKESWQMLVPELTGKGHTVLAIDYRGRGQSAGKLERPEDYQNIGLDVTAGLDYLQNKGVQKTIIIGASIGANHALIVGAQDTRVQAVVLLSPGLDYRGVTTEEATAQIKKPVLIVASQDDAYAAESSQKLAELAHAELIMYKTAGHGTDLFVEKDLIPKIVEFVEKT